MNHENLPMSIDENDAVHDVFIGWILTCLLT